MRKLHTLILSGNLTPHAIGTIDILSAIESLQLTVTKDINPEDVNLTDIHSAHQINGYHIDKIICYIKKTQFKINNIDDLFSSDSPISRSCHALTQMEKIRLMNDFYANKENQPGLNALNNSLALLFQQLEKR